MRVPSEAAGHSRGERALVGITAALFVLTVLHDLDHVRQARALDRELYVVAIAAMTMLTVTLVLLLRRHVLAELAAMTVGIATVLGVALVHVAPARSFFSDSYSAAHADALSWLIIILMMLGGISMALVSLRTARRLQARAPRAD